MSAKPSFHLGRALSAAAASLPVAWSGTWLALILVWAVTSFGPLAAVFMIGRQHVAFQLILLLLIVGANLMFLGALYRAILFGKTAQSEGLGFGGLQFGMPELRLLAADLLVGAFIGMILLALVIVFAVAFTTTGEGHGYANTFAAIQALFLRHEGSDWVFIVYLIGAAVFVVFLGLKFVLRHAATVAERRVVALNALGLSSGNVGKLFLGLIVIVIPFYIVAGVLMHLAMRDVVIGFVSMHRHLFGAGLWLRAGVHALLLGGAAPLMAGFLSSAYRQIVDLRAK